MRGSGAVQPRACPTSTSLPRRARSFDSMQLLPYLLQLFFKFYGTPLCRIALFPEFHEVRPTALIFNLGILHLFLAALHLRLHIKRHLLGLHAWMDHEAAHQGA